jgi:hypothetical protein
MHTVEANGHRVERWRPSLRALCPPTLSRKRALWSCAHYLRLFHNRDFGALYIVRDGVGIVHRSCIIPACFRWPFMGADDIQISSTWPAPTYRGRGLATTALLQVLAVWHKAGRRFWYLARAENGASIAVCRKAGFVLASEAIRTSCLGSRLLGQFVLAAEATGPGSRAAA